MGDGECKSKDPDINTQLENQTVQSNKEIPNKNVALEEQNNDLNNKEKDSLENNLVKGNKIEFQENNQRLDCQKNLKGENKTQQGKNNVIKETEPEESNGKSNKGENEYDKTGEDGNQNIKESSNTIQNVINPESNENDKNKNEESQEKEKNQNKENESEKSNKVEEISIMGTQENTNKLVNIIQKDKNITEKSSHDINPKSTPDTNVSINQPMQQKESEKEQGTSSEVENKTQQGEN